MFIEKLIKQRLEIGTLPGVKEVIEFKKKRLIEKTKELIDNETARKYDSLSEELLKL